MACAVDTNVIVALIAGNADVQRRAAEALHAESERGSLMVAPIVYSECLGHPRWTAADLDKFLERTGFEVAWEISKESWRDAGVAFAQHVRRRPAGGAGPRRIAADFVIGAHAQSLGRLLTSDAEFYRRNFPALIVIEP